MKRRGFIAGVGAGLIASRGSLAQPSIGGKSKTLIFVPTTNPPSTDPVADTAQATRTLCLMMYESLYTRDKTLAVHPHMVDGHVVEDDGKRWTMTLRAGQMFHDGTPVLARDCVASLQRWMVRDPVGASIKQILDALEAKDDKTIVWRLKRPFSFLPNALAKTQPSCAMMPERLAKQDPYKLLTETVGSGPFRWVADEFVAGSRVVCAKNDKYVPRPEPVDYGYGGYHVKVDRVEWRVIPDPATAASALQTGEVDWVEVPQPDLLAQLKRSPGVVIDRLDTHGIYPMLRPNFVTGPTTNVAVRRALMACVDQVDMMTAVMGEDRSGFRAPVGFFMPGTESASEAGMEAVGARMQPDAIRAMLKEGGYGGERIVLMNPTDQAAYTLMCQVADAAFRTVGLNIDMQTMDWGTLTQRRTSREPLEKGGWSLFPSGLPAADYGNPVLATGLRTNGKSAFFGWPENTRLEQLRADWIDSSDAAERHKIAEEFQREAMAFVPLIPLGQYIPATGYRSNIKGLLRGPAPVFWNVEKT